MNVLISPHLEFSTLFGCVSSFRMRIGETGIMTSLLKTLIHASSECVTLLSGVASSLGTFSHSAF